jgi:hypothetical protein
MLNLPVDNFSSININKSYYEFIRAKEGSLVILLKTYLDLNWDNRDNRGNIFNNVSKNVQITYSL